MGLGFGIRIDTGIGDDIRDKDWGSGLELRIWIAIGDLGLRSKIKIGD